jgi:hypothetical protein
MIAADYEAQSRAARAIAERHPLYPYLDQPATTSAMAGVA